MAKWMIATLSSLLLLIAECGAQLDVCGQPPLNSRIVGGQDANDGDWPWQVSLHRNGNHFCGASLINNQWLLTAAHCLASVTPQLAYLGRLRQSGSNPNEVSRSINRIIIHPNYNPRSFDNDIGLLRLSSPVTFSNFIRPVCLADTPSTFFDGTDSWVTGWGRIEEGGAMPQNLMEVEVPVVGNRQCNCDYNPTYQITDNMICAGLREGGKDSCQGDSGGPMMSKDGSRWVQSGVISFGIGCARPEFPGVYARVSRYRGWISDQLGNTNLPGFVTFTSPGTDPDLGTVTCSNQVETGGTTRPPVENVEEVTCGSAPLNTRLLSPGATSAQAGMWPWVASLHFNGSHRCEGTLVNNDVVLTNTECVSGSGSLSDWTVYLGRLRQSGSNSQEVQVSVSGIVTSSQSGQNVALVTLASPVQLSDFIQPICIERDDNAAKWSSCWVAGWTVNQGEGEQILREVQTQLVNCTNILSDNSICTEPLALDQGQSGSPLMCKLDGSWYQAGVLSTNTGREDEPTVFASLSQFNDFLRNQLGELPSPASSGSVPLLFTGWLLASVTLAALCH
ncbi:polyserase-2-like [Stigmatopora nigra]